MTLVFKTKKVADLNRLENIIASFAVWVDGASRVFQVVLPDDKLYDRRMRSPQDRHPYI